LECCAEIVPTRTHCAETVSVKRIRWSTREAEARDLVLNKPPSRHFSYLVVIAPNYKLPRNKVRFSVVNFSHKFWEILSNF
jgi:hypothetical protein